MARIHERAIPREDPVRLRDAALHRISLTRRWLIIAAAGLTAGLAALVSAILPGKSLGAKSSTTAPVAATRATAGAPTLTPPLPAPASAGQLGVGSGSQQSQPIAPPAAAPAPAPTQSAPTQSAPAQSAPVQSAPAQSAPVQSAPAPVSGGS